MGFVISRAEANALALGSEEGLKNFIKPFFNGRDLAQIPRGMMVLDLFGLSESELKSKYPLAYQHVFDNVKPERDQNNRAIYRNNWWIFGEPRRELRPAIAQLSRIIATTRTAKHRIFQFIDSSAVAESKLVVAALSDANALAILSSRIHEVFSLAVGGWLGYGNDPTYNHSDCFNKFPFPNLTEAHASRLSELGEELDSHRKRQQAAHPKLTLTQMYNVLEKLRAGETIEGKNRETYDQGLIGILRDLHDQIDAAVADAYGWPHDLSDEDILFRLVALNKERAEEEARGHIRWLRPDYQNPDGKQARAGKTEKLALEAVAGTEKAAWPKTMPEQIAAVREALKDLGEATPEQVARRFKRARATSVEPLLESLAALGQAEMHEDGRYAA